MEMLRRRLYTPCIFHIDTNLINARGKLDEMNQIENWAENGVIILHMSEVSFSEAQQGNNEVRNRKTLGHTYSIIGDDVFESDPVYQEIAGILFPNGIKDQNQRNDVKIVYHAHLHQVILITNDGGSKKQPGGILGNAKKLRNIANIMSPTEAVQLIKIKIKERDDHNHEVRNFTGKPVPEWTGHD